VDDVGTRRRVEKRQFTEATRKTISSD
jgi:hypothetical protein